MKGGRRGVERRKGKLVKAAKGNRGIKPREERGRKKRVSKGEGRIVVG